MLPDDHEYGDGVSVVEDFNDWTPGAHTFVRRSNQTSSTSVMLEENGRYAFRYDSDEAGWANGDAADDCEPNAFGTTNCVVRT